MSPIPASAGWQWIKDGFALFRKQPAEFCTVFLAYMFLMLGLGIIPVLGQVLPLVLVPTFTMAFMQACIRAQRGQRITPGVLLDGFRSPAFPKLLRLGGLYLLAAVVAVGLSTMLDGGIFWQAMSGQVELDPETIQESDLTRAMLLALALYLPAAMAFWHAAPLIMWQRMGVFKSIFYSFFAVRRATAAFVLYGLGWVALGVFLPVIVSGFLSALIGRNLATMLVLLPLSVVLTTIMYCSFYMTYVQAFGPPPGAPGAPDGPKDPESQSERQRLIREQMPDDLRPENQPDQTEPPRDDEPPRH